MADEILIVDENPGVQRALKRFLTQSGYSVVTANSVQSAMSLIGQSTPSLMILDIRMPRIDGIELIHLLREKSYPFPVIVMTAYPTFFTREQALKNGVSAYVTKPFDPEEILEYICQLQTCGKAYGS